MKSRPGGSRYAPLTRREGQALERRIAGWAVEEIAVDLRLSRNTVQGLLHGAYASLGVHTIESAREEWEVIERDLPVRPFLPEQTVLVGATLRFRVLQRDGFTCQYCGRKAPDVALQVDHVIPVASGGTAAMDNLRTACADCNTGKGGMPL